jgi:predicted AAA+ superfamily ATPase
MIWEALTSGAKLGLLPAPRMAGNLRVLRGIDALIKDGYLTTFADWRKTGQLNDLPQALREADRCADFFLVNCFQINQFSRIILRKRVEAELRESIIDSPVTTLLGPRQCGKTTLARQIGSQVGATFFDMQDPQVVSAFQNPKHILMPLDGLVILDEAQLVPALYPVLRVLVDDDRRTGKNRRFLLLGSAAPELIKGVAESLAGRSHLIPMQGFCIEETGPEACARLWSRGGFPDSFLAADDPRSLRWRRDFVETFLLRDLPQYGVRVPAAELRRLWMMCAHLHGRLLNVSELAQSLGRSRTAVSGHLDILEDSFMIRRLQPWFENIGKRQRKSPKLFIRDCGLLHALLGIRDEAALHLHPAVGASWEGFVLEQILAHLRPEGAYFWQTQAGAELDLLALAGGKRIGFEMKLSESPRTTKSMRVAINDLRLDHLYVIHPGELRFPLDEGITALPAREIPALASFGI